MPLPDFFTSHKSESYYYSCIMREKQFAAVTIFSACHLQFGHHVLYQMMKYLLLTRVAYVIYGSYGQQLLSQDYNKDIFPSETTMMACRRDCTIKIIPMLVYD